MATAPGLAWRAAGADGAARGRAGGNDRAECARKASTPAACPATSPTREGVRCPARVRARQRHGTTSWSTPPGSDLRQPFVDVRRRRVRSARCTIHMMRAVPAARRSGQAPAIGAHKLRADRRPAASLQYDGRVRRRRGVRRRPRRMVPLTRADTRTAWWPLQRGLQNAIGPGFLPTPLSAPSVRRSRDGPPRMPRGRRFGATGGLRRILSSTTSSSPRATRPPRSTGRTLDAWNERVPRPADAGQG